MPAPTTPRHRKTETLAYMKPRGCASSLARSRRLGVAVLALQRRKTPVGASCRGLRILGPSRVAEHLAAPAAVLHAGQPVLRHEVTIGEAVPVAALVVQVEAAQSQSQSGKQYVYRHATGLFRHGPSHSASRRAGLRRFASSLAPHLRCGPLPRGRARRGVEGAEHPCALVGMRVGVPTPTLRRGGSRPGRA
jgi:hypothetical protein